MQCLVSLLSQRLRVALDGTRRIGWKQAGAATARRDGTKCGSRSYNNP